VSLLPILVQDQLELCGVCPDMITVTKTRYVSKTARQVDFVFRAEGVKMRHLDLMRDNLNTSSIDFGNGDAERSVCAGNLNIRVRGAWVLDIGEKS